MFDEQRFPYEYECAGCEAAVTVAHEDVQDVPSYLATSTAGEAAEYVMTERRGWSLGSGEGHCCPACTDAGDSAEPDTGFGFG
ncbi:hypothetical protein [Salinibacter altiplanensis]|uniref:hypothetical protein n=1 Tax=Salinibacter altiplanensis TaxID=1803181 RepID=UPI000C9F5D55|nr:hypothetical protein [Salinibacter altiplanensis]